MKSQNIVNVLTSIRQTGFMARLSNIFSPHFLAFCWHVSPDSLHLPPPSLLPKNNILKKVIKLGDGVLLKPDIDVDKEGTLYTATRDGWIIRLHTKGSWENWKKVNSDTVFGITFTKDGDLVTCDTDQEGLLKPEGY
ncbi:hypothetical protein ACFX2C_018085 [Malus domestica]